MASLKLIRLLGCLLLMAPLLYGQEYSLGVMNICWRIFLEAASAVASSGMPLFRDLVKCTNLTIYVDLESIDVQMAMVMGFSLLQHVATATDCLWNVTDAVGDILEPHLSNYSRHQCSYIGVPQSCLPRVD
ncbi:uncharacterized protein DMAD_04958 [Drosophila madeirensis]|uniref:Uncharacterized protein n=1 Tax=Drosophila madeirensis TaxID=30013 RepID=A0AAU9GES5_DROMD